MNPSNVDQVTLPLTWEKTFRHNLGTYQGDPKLKSLYVFSESPVGKFNGKVDLGVGAAENRT